jgi:hypothetical protein
MGWASGIQLTGAVLHAKTPCLSEHGGEALWLGGMLVIGRVRQTILFEGSPLSSEPIGLPKELEKKSNEVERQAFLV